MSVVIAVEKSENRKLGPASATYVGQASCPPDCPFLGAGCYAEHGPLGIHTQRLNRSTITEPRRIATKEAQAIKTLSGMRPLRLHVVGDARTAGAAKILARAASAYRKLFGQPVWTYTHAWRDVPKVAWGKIEVLASVESVVDAWSALMHGYAPALVVERLPKDGRAYYSMNLQIIPCPAQTRGRTCVQCKLCFDTNALIARGAAIGFAAHGARKNLVKETVNAAE